MIFQYSVESVVSLDFLFDLASFWGSCWEFFLKKNNIVSNPAKNVGPHENSVNSNENEGWTAAKTSLK